MIITRLLWDMPITINVVDVNVSTKDINEVFDYFEQVDKTFSTFRDDSEISRINREGLDMPKTSSDMKEVLELCDLTKRETSGYFDACYGGKIDPLGIVKGWAINRASLILKEKGFEKFFIEAGGDAQVSENNWTVGIRNPFNRNENVKIVHLSNAGIATSGSYIRGDHIINPHDPGVHNNLRSLTVIAPNVLEADRFATAAYAMGEEGIKFLSSIKKLEAYAIDSNGIATYTSGFESYEVKND